ncbi:glycine zipper 2TM domain-containing protein [Kaarinaea lacus]
MNNINKVMLVITTSLTLVFSSLAFADHKRHAHKQKEHVRYAKVIHVKPIYRKVRVVYPEQQCWREEVKKPVTRRVNHASPEAVVLGGFIGGVIGHELGKNNNPELATVAGALIGSTLVHNANTQYYRTGEYRVYQRRHCRTENHYRTERQLKGYRVTYRYRGELYTTRMKHHPGKRIPIDRGRSH